MTELRSKIPSRIGLITLYFLAAGVAPRPDLRLSAVVTQIEGAVEVTGAGTRGLPMANLWQVVQAGGGVRVPEGGSAGVVCSNRRFVRIKGPAIWSLSEEACAKGKELTPGEYALVVPRGGRFRVVEGIMVVEREIRTEDFSDPLAPIVLAPRNTTVRLPRPTVVWSRVASATEYEVKWTGRGVDGSRTLPVADVDCSEVRDGLTICALPWPSDRADLAPGETFYLRVSARGGLFEPWHFNSLVKVETQTLAASQDLERRMRDLENLGLGKAALDAARAGLLADRGLLSEAAEAYRQSLAKDDSPELRITRADLRFSMGLLSLADQDYREALKGAEPAGRAAAAKFGLGRIANARQNFLEAEQLFREAGDLYSSLHLEEETEVARKAESRAGAKARKQVPKAPVPSESVGSSGELERRPVVGMMPFFRTPQDLDLRQP